MMSKELIESIKCALPHECPKKIDSSNRCIYCEINYSFIVKEPLMLECEHQVCKECMDQVENKNCKICSKKIEVLKLKSRSAQFLIESHLSTLFEILKDKFNKTFSVFEILQNENEAAIGSLEHKIKNEIDLRVEVLKNQLDNLRNELIANLKKECDQLRIVSNKSNNRSYNSLNTELKGMQPKDYSMENLYKYQNNLKEMMIEIQQISKQKEIEFTPSIENIEISNLGKLSLKNKNASHSSSDDILLSVESNGQILLWNSKYEKVKSLKSNGWSTSIQSVDGKIIGCFNKEIKIWDEKKNVVLKSLKGYSETICCMKLINEKLLASGYFDSTIIIWDIESGEIVHLLKGHSDCVESLELVSYNRLASGSCDDSIIIWSIEKGTIEKFLNGHENSVDCLRSINSNLLASGSADNTIKIWDIDAGAVVKTLKTSSWVTCLELVDSNLLASGSSDKMIKIWDIDKGCVVKVLEGHKYDVTCLQILSDFRLASGSNDTTIKIWDLRDCKLIKTLTEHKEAIKSLNILKSSTPFLVDDLNTLKLTAPKAKKSKISS